MESFSLLVPWFETKIRSAGTFLSQLESHAATRDKRPDKGLVHGRCADMRQLFPIGLIAAAGTLQEQSHQLSISAPSGITRLTGKCDQIKVWNVSREPI